MVAHLLRAAGMDLGPEAQLSRAAPDNPDGHWEHPELVRINEEILRHLGGSWDLPPALPWHDEHERQFGALAEKARALTAELRGSAVWGWKDPRNCLTLPFWRRLIPDMRVVLVLRHPAEVAASLHTRNGVSRMFSYHLWRTYNERIVATADPQTLLVTHYNSFFADPAAELSRVLHHVGLSAAQSPALVAMVNKKYRHHYAMVEQTVDARLPQAVAKLYADLVARIGETNPDALSVAPPAEWRASSVLAAKQPPTPETVAELRSLVAERTAWAQNADWALAQATARIGELQREVDERSNWALQADNAQKEAAAALAQLRIEFEERTEWALRLQDEWDTAQTEVARLRKELSEANGVTNSTADTLLNLAPPTQVACA